MKLKHKMYYYLLCKWRGHKPLPLPELSRIFNGLIPIKCAHCFTLMRDFKRGPMQLNYLPGGIHWDNWSMDIEVMDFFPGLQNIPFHIDGSKLQSLDI